MIQHLESCHVSVEKLRQDYCPWKVGSLGLGPCVAWLLMCCEPQR